MKIIIFGTGGVGGYFGGRLAQAGADVTFIARGAHLDAIQKNGLRVDSIAGDFMIHDVQASDAPKKIKDADVIILATKAWQLTESMPKIRAMMNENVILLPLLNGMEHMNMLQSEFENQVLGGFCRISSFVKAPGRIEHVSVAEPLIAFNEWSVGESLRVGKLLDIFGTCKGLKAEAPQNIKLGMWEKYLLICAYSGVGAVTRQPVGVYRSIPESRALFKQVLEEVVQVANTRGVALTQSSVEDVLQRFDKSQPHMIASMQKDIMEGRPSELEAQIGALVRMAHAAGIRVPASEFIYASLLPQEKKARGEV